MSAAPSGVPQPIEVGEKRALEGPPFSATRHCKTLAAAAPFGPSLPRASRP